MSEFLVEAVEERHGERWVEHEDDAVEDDLVANRNIPVGNEVRVFIHAFRVRFKVIVGNEECDEPLEGNREQISLNLHKALNTKRVMRMVVAT